MKTKTKLQVVGNLTVTYHDGYIDVADSHSSNVVTIDTDTLKIIQSTIRQNGNGVITNETKEQK